jgi:hypothetical protein
MLQWNLGYLGDYPQGMDIQRVGRLNIWAAVLYSVQCERSLPINDTT